MARMPSPPGANPHIWQVLVILGFLLLPVQAETLENIETNATSQSGSGKAGTGSPSTGRTDSERDTSGSILGQIFGKAIGYLLLGEKNHPEKTDNEFPGLFGYTTQRATIYNSGYVPENGRQHGDPDLPVLRLDLAGGSYSSDIRGLAVRAEIGWGPVALRMDRIGLSEGDSSRTSLSRISIFPMMRISPTRHFELDVGAGFGFLTGSTFHDGGTVSGSLSLSPVDWASFRWTPSWSWFGGSVLYDQDLSLWWNNRWISLFAGWRWIGSGCASTNGPQAGLSLSY